MFCLYCQRELAFCVCPDIEDRLKTLRKHPNLELRWCEKCDRHADRCVCVKN